MAETNPQEPLVSFRTGSFSEYRDAFITGTGTPQEGCLYFLTDEDGRSRIFKDGIEYCLQNASEVTTPRKIIVTKTTGNYTAGDEIAISTDLMSIIEGLLSKDIVPTAVNPRVTLSNVSWSNKSYEVGTTVDLTYTASLSAGSYSVEGQANQDAGVTATGWSISAEGCTVSGSSESSGTLGTITMTDSNSTTLVALTAVATGSQGNMPKTFLGKDYPSIRFASGATYSKKTTGAAAYRAVMWGYASDTTIDFASLTGAQIRSIDDSTGGKKARNPLASPITTTQMQQMFFAAPAGKYSSITVSDKNTGLPQTVKKYADVVSVEGANGYTAIDYDVWYIKNAAAEDGTSTFVVTAN